MKKNLGFTMVELLMVMAIIGILSSVVVVSLGDSRAKSRDAIRAGDLKSLGQAAELYQQNVNDEGNIFLFPLHLSNLEQYFTDGELPTDPKTGDNYYYWYSSSGPKEYCFGAMMETESLQNGETCNFSDPNLQDPNPSGDPNYVIKGP